VLSEFQPATVEETTTILQRSALKQCKRDPVPTWLIKRAAHVIAPVITGMCNASFMQVKFPDRCKKAIVRPSLKKRILDPNDPSSYRPISNLSFVSKVVEKVVDARLTEHSNKFDLLPRSSSPLTVLIIQRRRQSSVSFTAWSEPSTKDMLMR